MYLVKQITFTPNETQQVILGCLTYASRKLWNIANYERKTWEEESGLPYPDWYEQKKRLKSQFWFKNLPSQTAQEVLKMLEKSWKSFFSLLKTKGVENPKPPGFKQENFTIRYLNNGFRLNGNQVRLSLPKQLKKYLREKHNIQDNYIYVDVPNHLQLECERVKTIELKPLRNGKYQIYVVVGIDEPKKVVLTEKYMAIDIGVSNFMTCYVYDGSSYIFSGKQLLSINRYYDKTISHYEAITWSQQNACGEKYPKNSKRMNQLYEKRGKQVYHHNHCLSKKLVEIAEEHGVEAIVFGNITGIRDSAKFGKKNNQKFHKLPFRKIIDLVKYKAKRKGVAVDDKSITEEYTSQTCSACKDEPSKENARKSNRKHRGLYVCKECDTTMNADVNGAINIGKKYLKGFNTRSVVVLDTPKVYRFNGDDFVA